MDDSLDSELDVGEEFLELDSDIDTSDASNRDLSDAEQEDDAALSAEGVSENERKAPKLEAKPNGQVDGTSEANMKPMADNTVGPFLQLPMDIIRQILNELNSNDLNVAALTCSTLHALAVEFIYQRFEIVWPDDEAEPDENRHGVDALTYGLSTLALAQEVFEPPLGDDHEDEQDESYTTDRPDGFADGDEAETNHTPIRYKRYRLGNNYARFIRKLSIGNGPPQFVKDYTADKEAGKMLNTLVTLVIGRCKRLEDFKWDMPTGITRDVWLALASGRGKHANLSKVWIRIHDRRLNAYDPYPRSQSVAHPPGSSSPPPPVSPHHGHHAAAPFPTPTADAPPSPEMQTRDKSTNHKNVSLPLRTFSLLPPLQSLSVVEIDVPQYLYEMSELIGRSRHCLRSLRVSIAGGLFSRPRDWKEVWEGADAPDPYEAFRSPNTLRSQKRAGGVLGTLTGRFFSVKEYERAHAFTTERHGNSDASDIADRLTKLNGQLRTVSVREVPNATTEDLSSKEYEMCNKKLQLDALELNFISLSMSTIMGAFDWTRLTTLTLLSCPLTDNLWALLRRHFTPKPPADGTCYFQMHYPLALRRIRTDAVSPVFIKLLAETLAPNSVETLILKENASNSKRNPTRVSVKQLFKGGIRRHGNSLEILTIDSASRKRNGFLNTNDETHYYQQWIVPREILSYITSGAMSRLQELCVSIDYKDWHFFLRRLPRMPRLRALYVPMIRYDGIAPTPRKNDAEDLAYSVADAITFRPEIGLSYFALHNQCYEIFESKTSEEPRPPVIEVQPGWTHGTGSVGSEEDDGEVDVDIDDGDESNAAVSTDNDEEESEDDLNLEGEGWGEGEDEKDKVIFNIKEILFPDEKVEIFRTRKLEL
ncbi:MAG: hypothetical protein Q9162_001634 [Coniocarpon cinnabarinum]